MGSSPTSSAKFTQGATTINSLIIAVLKFFALDKITFKTFLSPFNFANWFCEDFLGKKSAHLFLYFLAGSMWASLLLVIASQLYTFGGINAVICFFGSLLFIWIVIMRINVLKADKEGPSESDLRELKDTSKSKFDDAGDCSWLRDRTQYSLPPRAPKAPRPRILK